MVDILISDNGFGKTTYEKIGNYDMKYIVFDDIEKLCGKQCNFMHICAPYNKKYFYFLKQCVDMCDRVKCIVIHTAVDYDFLLDTQNRIGLPIFYMPHLDTDNKWVWSMIGTMGDRLIIDFENMLHKVSNKYHKMIGL